MLHAEAASVVSKSTEDVAKMTNVFETVVDAASCSNKTARDKASRAPPLSIKRISTNKTEV